MFSSLYTIFNAVTINVNAAGNDPPVAKNDSDSTDEDTPVNIVVLSNDSDPDSDTLTTTGIVSGSGPNNGVATLSVNGSIVYTPNPNFNGQDSFVYSISDGNGGADTATGALCRKIRDHPWKNIPFSTLTLFTFSLSLQ